VTIPKDKTLKVTIPEMNRIEDSTFPDAAVDDEEALKNNAGIHQRGTGFPWQEEANVYLAGHRLGYPTEASFLAFWDLDALENGDEVLVTDANGTEYTYRVFKEFVVNPTDVYVTEPIEGQEHRDAADVHAARLLQAAHRPGRACRKRSLKHLAVRLGPKQLA
jgi:sortase A